MFLKVKCQSVRLSARISPNVWRLLAVGLSKHQLFITTNVYMKIQMFFSEGKQKMCEARNCVSPNDD
jgi:hypothetical protein